MNEICQCGKNMIKRGTVAKQITSKEQEALKVAVEALKFYANSKGTLHYGESIRADVNSRNFQALGTQQKAIDALTQINDMVGVLLA